MKVEQDEIEKMTFEKLLKFANETIFFRNDILQVLQNNEKIAKDEIEFLYNNSTTEQRNNLVKIYPEKFKDFYFLDLYPKYRSNLKNEYKVIVETNESDKEIINNHHSKLNLNDLQGFFNDWENEIFNLNHGKLGLRIAIKREVKKQLDEYRREDENKFKKLTKTKFSLSCAYCMLILHSKWVYLLTQKIIEKHISNENYYKLNLNENKIRFTITSLVHILIRHYGPLSKIAKSYKNEEECSNHNKNVHFAEIHIILETIFNDIDNSKILNNYYVEKLLKTKLDKEKFISFEYKKTIYKVYFRTNKNGNESKKYLLMK